MSMRECSRLVAVVLFRPTSWLGDAGCCGIVVDVGVERRSYPDPERPGERRDLVVKLCKPCIPGDIGLTIITRLAVSQDPQNYADAPTEGIRRVLEIVTGTKIERGRVLDANKIGACKSRPPPFIEAPPPIM